MSGRRLGPGAYLVIPEAHYLYGSGTLTLRVAEEVPPAHRRQEWLRVVGHEVDWRGVEAGRPREMLVRAAALPMALKPEGWRPRERP